MILGSWLSQLGSYLAQLGNRGASGRFPVFTLATTRSLQSTRTTVSLEHSRTTRRMG